MNMRVTIAGAGAVGCYVGGCLALAGREVTLLARPAMAEILRNGLRVSDFEGRDRTASPSQFRVVTDAAETFFDPGTILVTVKSLDTAAMAESIRAHAAAATVVSLQNGVGNIEVLKSAGFPPVTGMVPFNVVVEGNRFHRATGGEILVDDPQYASLLNVEGLPTEARDDMPNVQWAKLLMNLNNALNALAGIPLLAQLNDPKWRRVMALQSAEALDILRSAGIKPAKLGRVSPNIVPYVLQLPTPLFRFVAKQMLAIDPSARLSMYEDLRRGRPTEIDFLQGAIAALAEKHGKKAPMTERVIAQIKHAEAAHEGSPNLSADALLR
ncbi:2-dehydropantoate 2-reductase [Variibacter gotjawalensis]|uniref:2-dehydropantoate 2-reductase n=1 Tax=Variibacter gotjawalensis TaxID=1333996 RepID=A0A0S3PQV5_9BRAD|nr:2-dehydropantoate 2-reductase [Variibacter gotjawalensis]NIK48557.1 2-dehydropantoate 2-reductase [Variibacter gotjawalensis]RZS50422.1 ketopantoate reductase [Variibacter gotjawalensis]BAT58256.1 2-dehydropantoate 2-reductase [Variibacter gotjawalensis]